MNQKKLLLCLNIIILMGINNIKCTIIISLGSDCTVAGVLRQIGLRNSAYPFDWMFSSFDSVYKSIEDDFKNFLNTLRVRDQRMIIDYYGLAFVHDFPTIHHAAALHDSETHEWNTIRDDWQQFIVPIKEKYQRRIDRLRKAFTGSEPVFLIRYPLEKKEAIQLRDLLIKLYPNLNFTIVAIGQSVNHSEHWNLERIRNFSITFEGPDFYLQWKTIFFDTLKIDPNSVRNITEDDEWVCDRNCRLNFINNL